MRPLNVLLLLARHQPPHPDEELVTLEALSKARPSKTVYFATTRPVAGLTPGVSSVAFYGDASMAYELLGTARFRGFIERGTDDWDTAIQTQELYDYNKLPQSCLGLIALSHVRVENGDIGSLDGVLEDGRRLTVDTVSQLDEPGVTFGTKISSIYFLDGHQAPPTVEETIALLRAKRDELENKVGDLAKQWEAQTHSARIARAEARDARAEIKEALASSDDNEPLEPAKPRDVEDRFEKLTRGCYPRLDFLGDSHFTLREYAAGKESVWDALGCLNAGTSVRHEIKRIENTQNWSEIKPVSGLRIYYRKLHASDGRLPVLIGRKANQVRTDIPYLRKHDQQ